MPEFVSPVGGSDSATAYRLLDTIAYIGVSGEQTRARCSVVKMHLRAGHVPPMHVHENADGTIHVVEGTVTAHTAEDEHAVAAGETVVLARAEHTASLWTRSR